MAKLIDPLQALKEDREAVGRVSAAEAARVRPVANVAATSTHLTPTAPAENPLTFMERVKADFRVFLTLVWRELLGVDPSAIQLDMAYWLQHGPDRAIIMAFRGFSKSWITGAYALWRLLRDPNEKVLVISASMKRAQATTNWCLMLIMRMDLLADLRPKPSNRQSATMFDVGNCVPAQSASFMAAGIGGQLAGFRATCIIPDDVESDQNANTATMREKIEEAVKEFESIIVPGGVIKYLGTPHTIESLYLKLLQLKEKSGRAVYYCRIWPALFPTREQVKGYKGYLAPYITGYIQKHGPGVVGHSTMPNRFTDDNLELRRAAIGNTEFALQFMLDLSSTFTDKYPLKLKDLITMDLDVLMGPEEVAWGNQRRDPDLPALGFDGDFFHLPAHIGEGWSKWQKVVAWLDPSGKGTDETVCAIAAWHFGRVYLLDFHASTDGFGDETLSAIAAMCVKWGAHHLYEETNFGGGSVGKLLEVHLRKAWDAAEKAHRSGPSKREDRTFGTVVEPVTAGSKVHKEKRILGGMEPVVQQHRLVVSRAVVVKDQESLKRISGEDTRHRYSLFYQFANITNEKDCLGKDDRIDAVAGAVSVFSEMLGGNPLVLAQGAAEDRLEAQIAAMFDEEDELFGIGGTVRDNRAEAAKPQRR